MSLHLHERQFIYNLLVETVEKKLRDYHPETEHVPFHHRLFGVERYAMFSFIHSINTTLGTSIWEQIAVYLARRAGHDASHGYKLIGNSPTGIADLSEEGI